MNEYEAAVRRREELRHGLQQMDATHEQRRAQLRVGEARTLDAQYRAAREAAEADLSHAEAKAAALGMMAAEAPFSTRGREPHTVGAFRAGQPLAAEQRVSDYARARGLVPEGQEDLDFGRYLRGWLTGSWDGAEAERRAMTEGTLTAGGHLVPTVLAAQVVDKARAATRVLQAGARLVPMESSSVKYATVVGDPTLAWHAELQTIAPSDPTLGSVTLTAKALAGRVVLSRELVEDAQGVDSLVTGQFAAQLAQQIDQAALYGTGTGGAPTGLISNTGVTKTNLAANGASPTYDNLVDSLYRVRANNYEPNAAILNPRALQSLGKIKDSALNYLAPPPGLSNLSLLPTTAVPINLTTGTSTDTSDVFVGDWADGMVIGVRTQLEVRLLTERASDIGAFELAAWWRGDIGVLVPAAFDVIRGVRA